MRLSHARQLRFLLILICCLLLPGCTKPKPSAEEQAAERPLAGLKLRLAVVDDPALAAAVGRVQGEWNAQTGAELQVQEITEKELNEAESLPADAVICPSHLLGVLAERGLVTPVPKTILRGAQWGGIFELLRLREAAWGTEIMAVPFGSPVLCCYYRADLLEKLNRRPPRDWNEYQQLAKLLASNSPLPLGEGQGVRAWCGTIEPLAPGWAGLTLLARAAPYAKHRENFSTLFNVETMEPLVAGPPFVQALEELVAAAKLGPADPFAYDPAAARAAFWKGECGMALSWPTASEKGRGAMGEGREESGEARQENDIRVGFVELPGSRRVYNLSGYAWDRRADDESTQVPLLPVAGRVGAVGAKSAHRDAAFQLLLWLSDDAMSPQISAASPAATLFRQSHLKSPSAWVEKPVSAAAALQYGEAAAAALGREQWLDGLRLPGRAEYLTALDEAVHIAVRGEKAPLDALLQAVEAWQKITDRLGREGQRAAYRHSLGLP